VKRKKGKKPLAPGAPSARIPLPPKGEKRHGDLKKYHRPKEKEHFRRELET
jgi:hypothetical protein